MKISSPNELVALLTQKKLNVVKGEIIFSIDEIEDVLFLVDQIIRDHNDIESSYLELNEYTRSFAMEKQILEKLIFEEKEITNSQQRKIDNLLDECDNYKNDSLELEKIVSEFKSGEQVKKLIFEASKLKSEIIELKRKNIELENYIENFEGVEDDI